MRNTKNLNFDFNAPEGYEIDLSRSKLASEDDPVTHIEYRPITIRPNSWEDYEKNFLTNETPSTINTHLKGDDLVAFDTLGKLLELRNVWWGNWRPDYNSQNNDNYKYYIVYNIADDAFYTTFCKSYNSTFIFPTRKMAEDFLKTYKDMFNKLKYYI